MSPKHQTPKYCHCPIDAVFLSPQTKILIYLYVPCCTSLFFSANVCINLSYILFFSFYCAALFFAVFFVICFHCNSISSAGIWRHSEQENNDPPVMALLHSWWMHFLFAVNQLNFTTKTGPGGNIKKLCYRFKYNEQVIRFDHEIQPSAT